MGVIPVPVVVVTGPVVVVAVVRGAVVVVVPVSIDAVVNV